MRYTCSTARRWGWVALSLLLFGCDGGDPTGSTSLSGEEAEALFQEVVDRETGPLPSIVHLFYEVRLALRDGAIVDVATHRLIQEHEIVRHAAQEAFEEGDREGALLLSEQARHLQFEIVIAVLGEDLAGQALTSVEGALHLARERLEGRWIPRALMARLDALTEVLEEAREELDAGNPAPALGFALQAAEELKTFSPGALSVRAEAAIARATAMLAESRFQVGRVGVDPLAAEALERAELFLDRAHWSYDRASHSASLELALTSYRHSSRAIQLNRRGVDPAS